jgi:hypothetical protein
VYETPASRRSMIAGRGSGTPNGTGVGRTCERSSPGRAGGPRPQSERSSNRERRRCYPEAASQRRTPFQYLGTDAGSSTTRPASIARASIPFDDPGVQAWGNILFNSY